MSQGWTPAMQQHHHNRRRRDYGPLLYIQEEGTMIASPAASAGKQDGYFGIRHSLEEIQMFLNPTNASNKPTKNLVHCPKCGKPSLLLKKAIFLFNRIFAGEKRLARRGTERDNFETHVENNKTVIAICLSCEHNRTPGTIISSAKIYNWRFSESHDIFAYKCKLCRFPCLSVHDKKSGEKVELPDGEPFLASQLHHLHLQCLSCGNKRNFDY